MRDQPMDGEPDGPAEAFDAADMFITRRRRKQALERRRRRQCLILACLGVACATVAVSTTLLGFRPSATTAMSPPHGAVAMVGSLREEPEGPRPPIAATPVVAEPTATTVNPPAARGKATRLRTAKREPQGVTAVTAPAEASRRRDVEGESRARRTADWMIRALGRDAAEERVRSAAGFYPGGNPDGDYWNAVLAHIARAPVRTR